MQFSSYELFKGTLQSPDGSIDTPRRLLAGSLAGICSVVSTYRESALSLETTFSASDGQGTVWVGFAVRVRSLPSAAALDLVRSRLSVESASLGMKGGRTDGRSSGIVGMTLCVSL